MKGTQMAGEMAEQPARLRHLIGHFEAIVERVHAVAPTPLNGITIVARGSSDHAGVYGRYLLEAATGKPVSLAAPSLHTLYGVEIDYSGQLVIAVSQSGATPEIVRTLQALQDGGGRGLAITNDPQSALARAAGEAVELEMGEERAVPATKTVTGQLTAVAIIASALGRVSFTRGELDAVPNWVQEVLDDPAPVAAAADALVGASQLIIVARGYLFAAALETALKIKEACSLFADGYSAADLRHGPIAAVTRGLPVVALWVSVRRARTLRHSSMNCARGRRACWSSAAANVPTYRCRPRRRSRWHRSSPWSAASSSRTSSPGGSAMTLTVRRD